MKKGKSLYFKIFYFLGIGLLIYTVVLNKNSLYTSTAFFIIGLTFLSHYYIFGGKNDQSENWWETISGIFCLVQGLAIQLDALNPFVYFTIPVIFAILLVWKYLKF